MVDFPTDIDNIVIGAIAGAIFLPVIGACTNALIPIAMNSFGAVGNGVGTIHAPMAAGGWRAVRRERGKRLPVESLVPVLKVKRFGRRTRSKKRLP